MRRQMVEETQPSACVFIGGMEGILDEHGLVAEMVPESPRFVLGGPGGAAARLTEQDPELVEGFASGRVYPALMRRLVLYLSR